MSSLAFGIHLGTGAFVFGGPIGAGMQTSQQAAHWAIRALFTTPLGNPTVESTFASAASWKYTNRFSSERSQMPVFVHTDNKSLRDPRSRISRWG